MKQIILIGDFSEDDENLRDCLNLLFPECRVEVFKGQREDLLCPVKYPANDKRPGNSATNPIESSKSPAPNAGS